MYQLVEYVCRELISSLTYNAAMKSVLINETVFCAQNSAKNFIKPI